MMKAQGEVQSVQRKNLHQVSLSNVPFNMIPGRQAGAKEGILGFGGMEFPEWFTSCVMKPQSLPQLLLRF